MATDPKKKKKAASKAKPSAGAIKDMESYLMGAQHGAQILMHKLSTQMSGGLQSLAGNAQQLGKDTIGADINAAVGPNGMIPVQKIQQNAQTGINSTP
jgi:hypothetical protein